MAYRIVTISVTVSDLQAFLNVILIQLCCSLQDFNWCSALCSPTAVAEFIVTKWLIDW